jgi:DNA-binding IscR family transcriptional regulator
LHYDGAADHLREVWVAARAAYRAVLEQVSLEDVVTRSLPAEVQALVSQADSWRSRGAR